MSRARSLLPLALATALGIVNGVWVFAPALKEQQEQQLVESGKLLRTLETEDIAITQARQGDVNTTNRTVDDEALKRETKH